MDTVVALFVPEFVARFGDIDGPVGKWAYIALVGLALLRILRAALTCNALLRFAFALAAGTL